MKNPRNLFRSLPLAALVLVAVLTVTTSAGHMGMPGSPAPEPTPAATQAEPTSQAAADTTADTTAQQTDGDTLTELAVSLVQAVLSLL